MKITKRTKTVNCPVCGKRHDVIIETIGDRKDGLAKCGKIFVVDKGVAKLREIELSSDEIIELFSDYLKVKIAAELCIPVEYIDKKSRCNDCTFPRFLLFTFLRMRFPLLPLSSLSQVIAWHPYHATIIHSLKKTQEILVDPCDKARQKIYYKLQQEIFITS